MKYNVTKWTIKMLYDTYKAGKLNLSPPYQRNFIWSIVDQQTLIQSIEKCNPIPNFFLLQTKEDFFEMVDGQQRSRTIISFIDGQFEDLNGRKFSNETHSHLLSYEFPVTIIIDIQDELIHKFYAMVNKTGIHLNKPEVRKADYFETNIIKLVDEINLSKKFSNLKLFTDGSMKRMNDVEFISELIVLIKNGHVDKKAHLDEYFSNDLTLDECGDIKLKFNNVLDKMNILNQVYDISKSRYKQRNDFYTLFDFILKHSYLKIETLQYLYKVLILIGLDIKPTQDTCEPLKEYARNCVTQSNSKLARGKRLEFFENVLLNTSKRLHKSQKDILSFYNLKKDSVVLIDKFWVFDIKLLSAKKQIVFKK